jgi:hypothetical protein
MASNFNSFHTLWDDTHLYRTPHLDSPLCSDVKDRSILRLREHNCKTPTPLEQPNPGAPVLLTGPGRSYVCALTHARTQAACHSTQSCTAPTTNFSTIRKVNSTWPTCERARALHNKVGHQTHTYPKCMHSQITTRRLVAVATVHGTMRVPPASTIQTTGPHPHCRH